MTVIACSPSSKVDEYLYSVSFYDDNNQKQEASGIPECTLMLYESLKNVTSNDIQITGIRDNASTIVSTTLGNLETFEKNQNTEPNSQKTASINMYDESIVQNKELIENNTEVLTENNSLNDLNQISYAKYRI